MVVIHELYQRNPRNTYVDVGPALDEYTFWAFRRYYQDATSWFAAHQCSWTKNTSQPGV